MFRGYGPSGGSARRFGAIFGAASVITPLLLGMCMGAVSSGRVRVSGSDVTLAGGAPWLSPEALLLGALALGLCAYLAAVYLCLETEGALREDFRRRALLRHRGGGALRAGAPAAREPRPPPPACSRRARSLC